MSSSAPSFHPVNPSPFLRELCGGRVVVRLKWGSAYIGRLGSVDAYMNVSVFGADEYVNSERAGAVGDIFIRCNNILYIAAATDRE